MFGIVHPMTTWLPAAFALLTLPLAAVPVNDDFADAEEIIVDQPLPITASGNTTGATVEAGETALDPTLAASVWYKVTSPSDGVVRIDTDGSDFQTRLAVGVGTGYGDLVVLAADNDPSDGTAVVFEVATGVEYRIGVFGWNGETGNLALNLKDTEGATISGDVTAAAGGAPLGGITVQAMEYSTPFARWRVVAETTTHGLGGYTLGGLAEGPGYRVRAIDGSEAHAPRVYATATFVDDGTPVVPSPDEFGIDFSLAAASTISGTVGASGGSGLGGITVQAFIWNATAVEWELVATTTSDGSGNYTLGGLPAGTYRVGFVDEAAGVYLSGFVNGADLDSAGDIAVGAGASVAADATDLTLAGTIDGTVTDSVTGLPLEDIQVQVLAYDAIDGDWLPVGPRARTAADGTYALSGLPYGDFRVAFADFGDGMKLPVLFGGTPDPVLATPVVLSAGSPAAGGIDGALETIRITGVHEVSPGVIARDFPGNPFAQFVFDASDDLSSWETEGMPFHAEVGPNSREVATSATQRFWRLRGPSDLQLTPLPDVHLRTSYTQTQANYRWVDRELYASGNPDFIHAFGYGDFNNDGQTDALVFPGTAFTFVEDPAKLTLDIDGSPSDGASLFTGGVPGGIHARKLLVGDLNGDTVDDAVLIDHGYDADPFPGAPLQVILSTPGGQFVTVGYPEHTGFHHAGALGDYDHDGDLDLFLTSLPDHGDPHLILENDGLGGFTPVNQLVGEVWQNHIWASEFFDLDDDGFLDLAIGGTVGAGPATVLWGSSRGTYGADGLVLNLPDGWDAYDFDAEDLDDDGDRDLMITLSSTDSSEHVFRLFLNEGNREFVDRTFERFDNPGYAAIWIDFAFVQDVDSDGDPDIVTDRDGALLKWENDGTGFFSAQQ